MQIYFLAFDIGAFLDTSRTQAWLKHCNLTMQLFLLVFHLDFELLPSHKFLGLLHVTIGKIVDPKMQGSIGLRLVRIDDLCKI